VSVVVSLVHSLRLLVRSRAVLHLEITVAERVRGTRHRAQIRRECLDHVIVMNAAGLHRVLHAFTNTSGTRQGHAVPASGHTAVNRSHRSLRRRCRPTRSSRRRASRKRVCWPSRRSPGRAITWTGWRRTWRGPSHPTDP